MKSFLCILLVLFSVTSVFSADPSDSQLRDIHKQCITPTVSITDLQEETGGSGFIVRSTKVGNCYHNVVLTANHIFHDGPMVVNTTAYTEHTTIKQSKPHPMFVYAKDKKTDLAVVLFTSETEQPTVTLDFTTKLLIGMNVMHCGHGMLDDARIDFGQVTQPKTVKPEVFSGTIRTNVYTVKGDSGGPLFLRKNNSVVGICQSVRGVRFQILTNQSYYIPIGDLKTWDAETNNALSFVYNPAERLPTLAFVKLKMADYEYEPEEENEDIY